MQVLQLFYSGDMGLIRMRLPAGRQGMQNAEDGFLIMKGSRWFNITKHNVTKHIYGIARLAHDIAGRDRGHYAFSGRSRKQ